MSQTIFRKRYSSNYTAIPNKYTRDSGISWKAKGILTHLLTLPQDWEVNASYLSDQSTDGLDSVYSGLNELIAAKYLWRRTRAGRAPGGYEVFVYDEPNLEDPFVESSGSGNSRSGKTPVRENPAQLKKEEEQSKEKEQSTEQAFSDLRSALNSDKEVHADAIDSRPPEIVQPASPVSGAQLPPKKERPTRQPKLADEQFLAQLKEANPRVDFDKEMRKMDNWLLARPGRQKTRAFVTNWINRVVEKLEPEDEWKPTVI
jgi:hypothetical protein